MSEKKKKIGFQVIRDNIENDGLEDIFLFFDNFSGENKVPELMTVTNYPIRLNSITFIAFCMEGHIKFNLGLKKMMLAKKQMCVILSDQIIQTTEISPDFKAYFTVVRRNFFNSQSHVLETINLHNKLTWNSRVLTFRKKRYKNTS
jgi:hypothetical protein